MTPVRSSTSAPVARSRLRAWLGVFRGPRRRLGLRGRALEPSSSLRRPRRSPSSSSRPGAPRPRARAFVFTFGAAVGTTPLPPVSARELLQLSLAEHRGRGEGVAPLRDAWRRPRSRAFGPAAELREVRLELAILDARKVNRDDDGLRAFDGSSQGRGSLPRPPPRANARFGAKRALARAAEDQAELHRRRIWGCAQPPADVRLRRSLSLGLAPPDSSAREERFMPRRPRRAAPRVREHRGRAIAASRRTRA